MFRTGMDACDLLAPEAGGLCLVSYRADELCASIRDAFDATLEILGDATRRRARLVSRLVPASPVTFTMSPRTCAHVRHRHKYAHARLPAGLRFYFRRRGVPTGRSAANLVELVDELHEADEPTIAHHIHHGDFSRSQPITHNASRITSPRRASLTCDVSNTTLPNRCESNWPRSCGDGEGPPR